ncbi:Metallo-dependent phosphatase, partial [Ascobolus immersus RN42]
IICISDLHTLPLPPLPPGDLLIIAGDLTEGTTAQLKTRLTELSALKSNYAHIIVIAGNHDRALDSDCDEFDTRYLPDKGRIDALKAREEVRRLFRESEAITYLENSTTTVTIRNRTYTIFGSPGSLATSKRTAFGYTVDEAVKYLGKMSEKVDILITHSPPAGYLDGGLGCLALRDVLWERKPRAHIFGHVHQGRGVAL